MVYDARMGLYDDDLEAARATERYPEAGRLALALDSAATVAALSLAVQALDQLVTDYPVLLDSDDAFKGWRARTVRAGRDLRAAGAFGWESFAEAHPSFVHVLDAPEGLKRFETAGRAGYQLWHPASWRTRLSDDEDEWLTSPDQDFSAFFRVLVEILPFQPALERFAAYAVDRLRRDLAGVTIRDRRFRQLDRVDAYEIDYETSKVEARAVLAIHDNAALTLVYCAPPDRFAALEPAMEEIIRSFRLKG